MRAGVVRLVSLASGLSLALAARPASALPVAYAGTGSEPLVAHAGVVVMMREGTRTILSVATSYDGPLEPFVLLVPLPAELAPADVRTLPRALFDKVVAAGAPRLVDSWEEDPCAGRVDAGTRHRSHPPSARAPEPAVARASNAPHVVEQAPPAYDVHVLTEAESAGVVTWLRVQRYTVKPELEATLSAYAARGAHFVAARIDPAKLEGGPSSAPHHARAGDARKGLLPPLRFTFDSDRFELPIGFGRANSSGTQDLVVYVLARHQRYAAMEWDDVLAPSGIELTETAAADFPSVYRSVFDRLVAGHDRAAVTEYVHDALDCEPCAMPPLDASDLLTLGADALPAAPGERESPTFGSGFVLTRMQLRYGTGDAVSDLSLRAVPPLDAPAAGAVPHDAFQALYTVRHPWEKPLPCDAPSRGTFSSRGAKARIAPRLAFGPSEDVDLSTAIVGDVPSLGLVRTPHGDASSPPGPAPPPAASASATSTPPPATPTSSACGCIAAGSAGATRARSLALSAFGGALMAFCFLRRRR